MAIIQNHSTTSLKTLRICICFPLKYTLSMQQSMHSRGKKSKVSRLFCNVEQQRYRFPNHSITALYTKPKTHVDNLGCMKSVAVCKPAEKGRGKRISMVLELPGEKDSSKSSSINEEDFNLESDAESSCHQDSDVTSNDEECNIDELFYHEGARKKLKLLADMVGADTKEPGIVLAKVVAVLKDFKKSGSGYISIHLPKK